MARNIKSFSGKTCIVGRGWAPAYKWKGDRRKFDKPSWYMFSGDKNHSPAISYYIDNVSTCAADLVADFGEPLSEALIPDGRFDLVILEFLPVSLFDKGRFALSNAARITATGGVVEVHSSVETLRDVCTQMSELGFSCQITQEIRIEQCSGDLMRRYFDPGFTGDSVREKVFVDKLVCQKTQPIY